MKIMSVDYGDRRTGIALSDIRGILASPLTVIKESYQPKLAKEIVSLAVDNDVKTVVIGLPRNMDGSYGYRCDECKSLGEAISNINAELNICFEDERLTTVMAHNVLSENNVRGKKRKDTVDAVSAVMILQSYLDKNK
ncbi:Holliday junction resolvase RuvX [Eubacterium sp.]|uniref:Holliday junction resolvase RuvX n=1 Tax=Eubacterium sp. TaxID=142586 RepID=UPI0025CE44BF|nr:Holliday junction resolvase RuvX [Eubacterium sp.]MBD8928836.1 Holliday junction resolvase RuvX [Clostridiales bacterium]MDD7332066.1 Holliday junction resolvase RuvX [Eubacterium sp.]MDY3812365.1 Holliday junction resolvase RuvX [Eubacterium sp.]MDY5243479.1 Holliday junction resolvase RuvX [Eubacterium sp.]